MIIVAVILLASRPALADTGVRAVLVPARALDAAALTKTAALIRARLAKIGFEATVSTGGRGNAGSAGQIIVHAPHEISFLFAGIALAQRGELALWWALPFTQTIAPGANAGTIAVWNDDWTRPEGRYVSLAFPAEPSAAAPGITAIDRLHSAGADGAVPALRVHFDAHANAALAASHRPGARLVLTLDDQILAVAPTADADAGQITILSQAVGFNEKSLAAIMTSASLPARMVILAAPYLGDSPRTGLIFGNPPTPATVPVLARQAPPASQSAAALERALRHMAIWGVSAAARPDGTIAVRFDNRQDAAGLAALVGATGQTAWHWGAFRRMDSARKTSLTPTRLPPSLYWPPMPFGAVPIQLRSEIAPVLESDDVTDAEIIRPGDEHGPFSVTLALTLRPAAARRIHEQMSQRGSELFFGFQGISMLPGIGGLMPMMTSDGRLLLTGMVSRDELWPAEVGLLRRTLPTSLTVRHTAAPGTR